MKVSDIKPNPDNPRVIRDEKFEKLKQSIKDFPKMMELRPIVVDETMTILGGNMRLRAIQELGMKEIPDEWVKKANELSEEQKKEFIIKDNVGFGEWDWDTLVNEWDTDKLQEWGLDGPNFENEVKDMSNDLVSLFKVEIDCESEREQEHLYNELTNKGYKCRILAF